ncbi:enoyl-CoA hydratase/isomerase family protein [Alcaligenes endophyticus]|uniref:Enoyl-CoA hydratase-related protein n=1 Tax=Alcaligenes endophyticus TaxID=1929088 RepID=A0ABT8EF24_9BURK|nr:enoyl-CoA hydratase-related protein [Alcaligenes endophyticus]MCX5590457.1 enoyl-CoA hydratase-related protein [Alcaligenes endophyticus]MDN4119879.1 enoyl-CoA hydratase-related protein [Alcaligenes endophyticus]
MNIETIGTLTWQVKNSVGVIHLNRPERLNAIGSTMKADLAEVFFNRARNNRNVKVVVITGTGDRAFCAGADLKERVGEKTTSHQFFFSQKSTHELMQKIENFEKPVIAAINGVALGGGLEIALCCDIRIAAEHAKFGLPEAKINMVPAAGGTQRLPRVIGASRAKQMLFLAEMISAEEALKLGLISKISKKENLMKVSMEMATKIASMPSMAISLGKKCVNTGLQVDLNSGLDYERYAASILMVTEDRKEGINAFVEKREPNFIGK